jgi:8-oxo-dGTP diphosphatase
VEYYDRWRKFLREKKDIDKIVKAVMIQDGKVLLLKRSDYVDKYAREWDLPGGHLQEDESAEQGLQREVEEETGLELHDPKIVHVKGRFTYYIVTDYTGDITLSTEHTEHRYVSESEIAELGDVPEKYTKAIDEAFKEQREESK